jgi:hypothetical protein
VAKVIARNFHSRYRSGRLAIPRVGGIIANMAKPKLSMRQENFCQLLARGIPPFRAYPLAGYKAHVANCYRLSDNERVKRRLAEIGARMMKKTEVTIESLLDDLAEDRELARELGQPSAAIAATQLTAKLCGLLVERKETGQPGAFSDLKTPEEIVAAIREELGDEAAELLVASLDGRREPDDTNRRAGRACGQESAGNSGRSVGKDRARLRSRDREGQAR